MTHTPGPWRLIKTDATKSRPFPLFSVDAEESFHVLTDEALDEPDARLIAAAPDLLEALKALVALPYYVTRTEYKDAIAAIAKAEGGK
jgi:hypothetical protein